MTLKGQYPIPITAVWLRRIGDRVEVLLEIEGAFRKVITEPVDAPFSHICESSGIMSGSWKPVSRPAIEAVE